MRFCCPLTGGQRLCIWGMCIAFWLYPHSHPPRMTDFISHAQESRFKIPHTAFALIELWRVESSRRGLLCLHLSILWRLASVHDIEIYPLRRCRQSVSDMHDISYTKKNENKHRAREYAPALSRQRNETQTAVKIQLTMHCISDSIVSKKNVRTRITWISRLRFLSRVIGRKEEVDFEQWLLIHKRSSRTYAEVRYHYPHPLFP